MLMADTAAFRIRGRVPSSLGLISLMMGGEQLSIQAICWVLKFSESRLGSRHVLISIASHANSQGSGSWPSVSTISRESKLSEREVRYALRELEKSGELITQKGSGPRGCNLYCLPLMKLQGQSLQGQKTTIGGQNPTETLHDFAPESSLEPSGNLKTRPHKPRTSNLPLEEKIRRVQKRDERLIKEHEIRRELNVGTGPELVRSRPADMSVQELARCIGELEHRH